MDHRHDISASVPGSIVAFASPSAANVPSGQAGQRHLHPPRRARSGTRSLKESTRASTTRASVPRRVEARGGRSTTCTGWRFTGATAPASPDPSWRSFRKEARPQLRAEFHRGRPLARDLRDRADGNGVQAHGHARRFPAERAYVLHGEGRLAGDPVEPEIPARDRPAPGDSARPVVTAAACRPPRSRSGRSGPSRVFPWSSSSRTPRPGRTRPSS